MSKQEVVNMFYDILAQLLSKISFVLMAVLGATITFITSFTHKKRTFLQSFVSSVLAFIVGITIGIICSYFFSKKEIVYSCISGGALLSDAIIKYILTNEDSIVKKIFKKAEKNV